MFMVRLMQNKKEQIQILITIKNLVQTDTNLKTTVQQETEQSFLSKDMSYTFVNPFGDYDVRGVKIKTDSLNAVQLAPGLKFIGNTAKGWQPYIGMKMVWNISDETKVKANEVNLPETSTKPYFEYGLGVQKSFGERFTGFGQAMFRGGGRNGVAFTLGTRWSLGLLAYEKKDKN